MPLIDVLPMAIAQNPFGAKVASPFFPLGCLIAYAKAHADGALSSHFAFGKVTPAPVDDVLPTFPRPAVVLLSTYVWNLEAVLTHARRVKEHSPESVVIVGGPQIPRARPACEAFLREYAGIDVAVRGEGELTLAEILETIARSGDSDLRRADLSNVCGLTCRSLDGTLVRTEDRPRAKDLGTFPSPYTTGEFDHWVDDVGYMPTETNRGCPYGCTFCDWGAATLAKIHQMSLERVFAEIEYAGVHRAQMLAFTDANFGIFPRDVEIARHLVATKEKYGFPKQLGYSNAKVATSRMTEIVKILWDAGLTSSGQISMQTTDRKVLEIIQRSNIKTSEYEKMIAFFRANDIPVSSEMMVGLPGQDAGVVQRDLQFMFDRKVRAQIYATSAMPNAPMSDPEYLKRYDIDVDDAGHVKSTFSFDASEYARMFELCLAYKLFVKLGLSKYLLYFMQVERGVKAMTFLAEWLRAAATEPERYPRSHFVKTTVLDRDFGQGIKDWLILNWDHEQGSQIFRALDELYREALSLYAERFGVDVTGADLEAVLAAQQAVMPGAHGSRSVDLPHDVAAYFAALRQLNSVEPPPPDLRRLADYPPARLDLNDAGGGHFAFWDFDIVNGRLQRDSSLTI